MHRWAEDLFPINRSLTGPGVRQTLSYLQDLLPELQLHEVPTGYKAFDWEVPREWTIDEAWIENEAGERIVDYKDHNLHLVGYSIPVDRWMSRDELDKHLHSLPEQPDAIPYVTSYYKERWGFCISQNLRDNLPDGNYRAVIKSELKQGVLNYADLVVPGESEEEILFSTYICHPSMANNELSGPVLAAALAQYTAGLKNRRYTYRFVFVPETIGAIVYIHRNLEMLRKNVKAGYILTCVGDERNWSYMPSRNGDTLADKTARYMLEEMEKEYTVYSFLQRASDERQYCSPGVDLPVCSVMRSKYLTYPEYHTSLDNLELVTPRGLQESWEFYKSCIDLLELNFRPRLVVRCEPQLGKRGLYSSITKKGVGEDVRNMRNILAYCDGTNDLIDLFTTTRVSLEDGLEIVGKLKEHKLVVDEAQFGGYETD